MLIIHTIKIRHFAISLKQVASLLMATAKPKKRKLPTRNECLRHRSLGQLNPFQKILGHVYLSQIYLPLINKWSSEYESVLINKLVRLRFIVKRFRWYSLGLSYPVLNVLKVHNFGNQTGFNSTNLFPTFSENIVISHRLIGPARAFRFALLGLMCCLFILPYHCCSLLLRRSWSFLLNIPKVFNWQP